MDREILIEKIRETAVDGRLSCKGAHILSEEMDIPLLEIGKVCNELKIRISNCQLGCF